MEYYPAKKMNACNDTDKSHEGNFKQRIQAYEMSCCDFNELFIPILKKRSKTKL